MTPPLPAPDKKEEKVEHDSDDDDYHDAAMRKCDNLLTVLEARLKTKKAKISKLTSSNTNEAVVREHIRSLDELVSRHRAAVDELMAHVDLTLLEEYCKKVEAFEDTYEASRLTLAQLLQPYEVTQPAITSPPPAAQHAARNVGNLTNLPKLPLPTFDGDYGQYMTFHTEFKAIISKASLADAEKLHYLRSALRGTAKNIQSTSDTFASLWEALRDRYEVKRIIVETHLEQLVEIRRMKRESPVELRYIIDTLLKTVRIMNELGLAKDQLSEQMFIFLVVSRLDDETRKAYIMQLNQKEFPDYNKMVEFLLNRCRALEEIDIGSQSTQATSRATIQSTNPFLRSHRGDRNRTSTHVAQEQSTLRCIMCKKPHLIYYCESFLNLQPSQRLDKARQLKLCINCLSTRHSTADCKRGGCRKCSKKHNTLLHLNTTPSNSNSTNDNSIASTSYATPSTSTSQSQSYCTTNSTIQNSPITLMPTAIVQIRATNGQIISCRALLDSASELDYMSENLAQLLRLKRDHISMSIFGVGGQKSSTASSKVRAEVQSRCSDYTKVFDCLILQKVSLDIPSRKINWSNKWVIPSDIELADPEFMIPHRVDILLGAKSFFEFFSFEFIQLEANGPRLQRSVFGWVVTGEMAAPTNVTSSFLTTSIKGSDESLSELSELVKRFWETEECQELSNLTSEEQMVEDHFVATHRRDETGRYIVSLPTKKTVEQLGDSRAMALKRFQHLERRLVRDSDLKAQYTKFIHEYLQLGHMSLSRQTISSTPSFIMPHHAVLRPDSMTTKLRVVFDGSATSINGLSLNDVLQVGATVQQDLFSIVIRFRKHQVAFTADIEKMYRQILVEENQRQLQQILWRDHPNIEIRTYELNTVTYGTASAPFLATRALKQLGIDESANYPEASIIVERDFYVDDVLSGTDTVEEAKLLQVQLDKLLTSGGFKLHKWCSNKSDIFGEQITSNQRVNFADNHLVKTLGLRWLPSADNLVITIQKPPDIEKPLTKRSVLSEIARLFDPLGIVGPVIVTAKILLQRLWKKKVTWDQELDEEDQKFWRTFRNQLTELKQISVPRRVIPALNHKKIYIIGFSDASETALGACIYIHTKFSKDQTTTMLLCAKSRVAPIAKKTIPRLELDAALLLARLLTKVTNAIEIAFDNCFLFSDSTITLSWIRTQPSRLKPYVANRVGEIQKLTKIGDWRHIATKENPADLISRGIMPSQLKDSKIWWTGPTFLTQHENVWPLEKFEVETNLPELKAISLVTVIEEDPLPVLTKFSSILKLQRVMAYVNRFISHCRKRDPKSELTLDANDLHGGLKTIIRAVQCHKFAEEIKSSGKRLSKTMKIPSNLMRLNLFLDDTGLLRVGGRLQNSELPYDSKHQLLLPKNHHITSIIIRGLHEMHGHVGPQALLAIVRQTFWPVDGAQEVRRITRSCIICFRCRPRTINQSMGNLPDFRVTGGFHPFINTGVDYAGPFQLKLTRNTTTKAYAAIFVCLSTKAVHIELVSDLTTKAFLAAVDRFVSRRGHCASLHCDNATNFVGAQSELFALHKMINNNKHEITTALAPRQISFHFIPPRAPHFGGVWEAAVKSAKYHLRRIVGPVRLTFEEMSTVLARVEAILNSRPITQISADPEDLTALTPGHFLIGRPLIAVVEPDLVSENMNHLRRWQMLQHLTQHFWTRWSREYLTTLQRRPGYTPTTKLPINSMVIIKEDNLPPSQWLMGRVIETYPGSDGLVRVATVRTKCGSIKRAVVKLALMPVQPTSSDHN